MDKLAYFCKNAPFVRVAYHAASYVHHKGIVGLYTYIKQQRRVWRAFPGWRAAASIFEAAPAQLLVWASQKEENANADKNVAVFLFGNEKDIAALWLTLHSLCNQTVCGGSVFLPASASSRLSKIILKKLGKSGWQIADILPNHTLQEQLQRASTASRFVLVLEAGVALHPCAVQEYRGCLQKNNSLVYSDEEVYSAVPSTVLYPRYKAGFGADTLRGYNYIGSCFAATAGCVQAAQAFAPQNIYDTLLRLSEQAEQASRVPKPLFRAPEHRPNPAESTVQCGVVAAQLQRLHLAGEVQTQTQYPYLRQVVYTIAQSPLVSIIIQNSDNADLLRQCVNSILSKTSWPAYEIYIVENNSIQPETFACYEELQKDVRVHLLRWDKVWNYSALNNYGAQHAAGEMLLFLNNDMEVLHESWVEELVMYAQRPKIGAVGGLLLYPEDRAIQHAGIVVGIRGTARAAFVGKAEGDVGYEGRVATVQNISAVTAACMMLRREVLQKSGGFNEEFAVGNNDVDLCLRLQKMGYLNIYTPFCKMLHYESATRAGDEKTGQALRQAQKEDELLQHRWKDVLAEGDRYYNPGLSAIDALFRHDGRGKLLCDALHADLEKEVTAP